MAGILSLVPLVGPFIANAAVYGLNFSGVFFSSAVITLAGAVLCLAFLVEPTRAKSKQGIDMRVSDSRKEDMSAENLEKAKDRKETRNLDTMRGLEKSNRIIVIISLIVISSLLSFMLVPMTIMAVFLLSITLLSVVQLWLPLLAVFSLVLGGVLADRLGRKRTLLVILEIGIALSLLSLLIFLSGQYYLCFIALMSIATFVSGASSPAVLALVADITPVRQRGLTYGLGSSIGGSIPTILVGIFFPAFYGLNGLPAIFALTLVLAIVATILVGTLVAEPETAY
jgi:MFS family permease